MQEKNKWNHTCWKGVSKTASIYIQHDCIYENTKTIKKLPEPRSEFIKIIEYKAVSILPSNEQSETGFLYNTIYSTS